MVFGIAVTAAAVVVLLLLANSPNNQRREKTTNTKQIFNAIMHIMGKFLYERFFGMLFRSNFALEYVHKLLCMKTTLRKILT
jgi:hypothetical protein